MAYKMLEFASNQTGLLGAESAQDEIGITVFYWQNLDAIRLWKVNVDYIEAQRKGIKEWYKCYKVRIAKVERDYDFEL